MPTCTESNAREHQRVSAAERLQHRDRIKEYFEHNIDSWTRTKSGKWLLIWFCSGMREPRSNFFEAEELVLQHCKDHFTKQYTFFVEQIRDRL